MPPKKESKNTEFILEIYDGKEERDMWKKYGKQLTTFLRPYFAEHTIKHYSKSDKDSVSFLLFDIHKEIKCVAICDRWINTKWYKESVKPQLYIGLLAGPGYGKIMLDQILKYAQTQTYKDTRFQLITTLAMDSKEQIALKFFRKHSFKPGYGDDYSLKNPDKMPTMNEFKLDLNGYPMHLCLT